MLIAHPRDRHKSGARGRAIADRRGVAALEFAILAPVMSLLVMGIYDATRIFILQQQLANTAQAIAEGATAMSTQPNAFGADAALTNIQAIQAMSMIFALIPTLKSGQDPGKFSVTLSAVSFSPPPCQGNCAANIAWSTNLVLGGADPSKFRPCGIQVQAGNVTPGDLTTIPTAAITAKTALLIADVHYQYTPLFVQFITGPIDLWQSVFYPPRSDTPYIWYDAANVGTDTQICPGYK